MILQMSLRREALAAVCVTAPVGLFPRVDAYVRLEVSLLRKGLPAAVVRTGKRPLASLRWCKDYVGSRVNGQSSCSRVLLVAVGTAERLFLAVDHHVAFQMSPSDEGFVAVGVLADEGSFSGLGINGSSYVDADVHLEFTGLRKLLLAVLVRTGEGLCLGVWRLSCLTSFLAHCMVPWAKTIFIPSVLSAPLIPPVVHSDSI